MILTEATKPLGLAEVIGVNSLAKWDKELKVQHAKKIKLEYLKLR